MEIIMIDTETTGLFGYPDDVVVEIALSRVDLDKGTVKPAYTSIVGHEVDDWSQSMKHAWIFENTDLTLRDVRNAPPIEKVVGIVREIVSGQMVTSYNVAFDIDLASANHEYLENVLDALCITEDKAKGYLRHRTGYIYPVDDPVLLDNPIPREKLQEHGIALPQSFVRLDAEVEALLMCLSKEAIA